MPQEKTKNDFLNLDIIAGINLSFCCSISPIAGLPCGLTRDFVKGKQNTSTMFTLLLVLVCLVFLPSWGLCLAKKSPFCQKLLVA